MHWQNTYRHGLWLHVPHVFWSNEFFIVCSYFSGFSQLPWGIFLYLELSMASRVPSHKRLKATVRTKRTFALKATFNLWNDRKFRQKGSTKSQLAEILLHQSVDKLRARCRSQEANDELKSIDGPAGLLQFACGFKFLRLALTRICFNDFPLRCDSVRWFWIRCHFPISMFL